MLVLKSLGICQKATQSIIQIVLISSASLKVCKIDRASEMSKENQDAYDF